jgi:hypothetical protein
MQYHQLRILCAPRDKITVIPKWWMENDIHAAHKKYLAGFGGHRAKNHASCASTSGLTISVMPCSVTA